MTTLSIVRTAKPEDYAEVWRLLLLSYDENASFPIAADKADIFVTRALRPDLIQPWDTGPRGVIGVIGPVGALEACCLLFLGSYWYTNERHIEEFLVFVDPRCRSSGHGRALVRWMKEQSDATGLKLVTGIISNVRTEAKVAMYSRMLPKVGAFFMYGGKGSVLGSSAAALA